ncbi:MAG: hypothetical protein ACOYH4_01765 [Saccharofermentanales bacterium]|jgi:hypothetical protein
MIHELGAWLPTTACKGTAFGTLLKWMLILLPIVYIIGLIGRAVSERRTLLKLREHGLQDAKLLMVDVKGHDDTLEKAILGKWIAGDWGFLLGMASGRYREQVKSMEFYLKYGDGTEETQRLRPQTTVCREVIKAMRMLDIDV